ncbi:MAG: hydrogenase maturation nickel metallochaperone HypA, partial [bacterium]
MHELSIANSIVSTVLEEMKRRELPSVKSIVLRVGALSDIVPESLLFSFEVITIDTPLTNTKLKIEHIPVQGKCHKCGHDFAVENNLFVCPHCQSGQIEITRGQELDIAYLEVENGHDD